MTVDLVELLADVDAVVEDLARAQLTATRRAALERALAAWVDRDRRLTVPHGIAVVPVRILDVATIDSARDVVTELAHALRLCGTIDDPWDLDGVAIADTFVHVCILDIDHAGDCPWLELHQWLDVQRDAATDQFDPLARIRRRVEDAAGILPNPFDTTAR